MPPKAPSSLFLGLELATDQLRAAVVDEQLDLVGVDASIANALRRILIAEVPALAIEHVYVWNNTSVIVDEVLAHRVGLVPLNVDPAAIDARDRQSPAHSSLLFFFAGLCAADSWC